MEIVLVPVVGLEGLSLVCGNPNPWIPSDPAVWIKGPHRKSAPLGFV